MHLSLRTLNHVLDYITFDNIDHYKEVPNYNNYIYIYIHIYIYT